MAVTEWAGGGGMTEQAGRRRRALPFGSMSIKVEGRVDVDNHYFCSHWNKTWFKQKSIDGYSV